MNAATERPRIVIGIVLVLLGALFLLANAGILRGFRVWDVLWGVFWLWLGAAVVGPRGRSVGAGRLALGLVLIAIGVITLADGLGLIAFSAGDLFGRFWPVVLIALGLAILLERPLERTLVLGYESNRRASTPAGSTASDRIVHDTLFGDFKLTQPDWQLRDIQANIVIGDMKIDLGRAKIPEGETTIDLRALIGDIDVWAPPDLPVALEVQCAFVTLNHYGRKQDVILRRYTDTPAGFESAPRRVRVRANLLFGDLNLTRAG